MTSPQTPHDLISMKEAAEILRCSKKTVMRHIKCGTITGWKVFTVWRVSHSEIMALIEEGRYVTT